MDIAPLPVALFLLVVVSSPVSAARPGYSTDIECYERVAVGKKLNETEVSSTVAVNTVRHCEQECERARCYAYSFGISSGGNGTCQLASKIPQTDPINDIDYDLFYKNTACINGSCPKYKN